MKAVCCAITTLLLVVGSAQAEVLALWENDPLVGNEATASANSLGTNVDSAQLGRGAGGTATTFNDTFAMRRRNETSLANALANNRYLTISIEADAGYTMNITNIFLRLSAGNPGTGAQFALFSSETGWAEGDELWTYDSSSSQWTAHTIDMSGESDLQGVQSVTFRLYHWDCSSEWEQTGIGRNNQTNGDDDLRIEGTTEEDIPEVVSHGGTVVVIE